MKWTGFFARQRFRTLRGQSYVSVINTLLLLGIAFKITSPLLIIGVGILTAFCIWLVGFTDEKLKIVHAESQHNFETITPYFQELKADIKEIKARLAERG